MLVLKGKGICGGVAFGKLSFYRRVCPPAERRQIPEPKEEIRRFETARAQALEQLGALYEKALPQAVLDLQAPGKVVLLDGECQLGTFGVIFGQYSEEYVCFPLATNTHREDIPTPMLQLKISL